VSKEEEEFEMSEPYTGAEGPIEECETELFRSLERYFELRRREVEESIQRASTEFKNFQEARRQLMEAEQELEQIQQRTAELKGEALNAIVESSEVSELEEGVSGVSELETELSELAEAEQRVLGRKRDAEERLRSLTELDIGEHLAEASNGLAAIALAKAEQIDALKERVEQRFAEGRTSVLRLAI
jgi:predicted nuclease with TOPRIM domain